MKKGFTLVEMMIVVLIILIILGVAIPVAMRGVRQANIAQCQKNMDSINSAIAMCYAETRNWEQCDTTGELVTGGYLENDVTCPFTHQPYNIQGNATHGYRVVHDHTGGGTGGGDTGGGDTGGDDTGTN